MPSLISGYEYDIFISYRQKDNKHDGWVTTFVEELKGELEATFKEDISIYFDENPSDGLLETHSVDKSLEGKLRCLIFIPIISRTYCDPKSYAWQHEFCAFNKLTMEDRFGRDIRLSSGNVASRILPVRIHDLDPEDKNLLEVELGGVLRGVEFIYKEAGVDRPLTLKDNEEKNLNKTSYRNQINKVALAIKEIFAAVKHQEQKQKPEPTLSEISVSSVIQRKYNWINKLTISLLVLVLIILGVLFVPKLYKSEGNPEKTIAVLLFHNYSGDPSQEYMCNGLTNEIIGHLYKIKSFDRVVPIESVLLYRETDKKLSKIANELKVNYILSGNYNMTRDTVRITAHLIDPKKDKILWQNGYDQPYKGIITIPADIAVQVADQLRTDLTRFEKQNIEKVPTTNQEAYQLIQHARNLLNTSTYESFDQLYDLSLKAIKLDPGYADAYAMAGNNLIGKGSQLGDVAMQTVIGDAVKLLDKALDLDQNNASAHCGLAMFNDFIKWDYIKAEEEFLKAIELSPNSQSIMRIYSEFLVKRNRFDDARVYLKKAESDPIRIEILSGVSSRKQDETHKNLKTYLQSKGKLATPWTGEYFIWLEDYEDAKPIFETAVQKGNKVMLTPRLQADLALVYFKTRERQKAQVIIDDLIEKSDTSLAGSPEYYTGWYYSGIGKIDSAFYWLEKAYKNRSPEIPWLKVDPVFKNLKSEDRYMNLYKRTGHKAYDDYRAGLKPPNQHRK